MKTPVTITAVHANVHKTHENDRGICSIMVEIDGKWIEIINETFDPTGFHISHICEGLGIKSRQERMAS